MLLGDKKNAHWELSKGLIVCLELKYSLIFLK